MTPQVFPLWLGATPTCVSSRVGRASRTAPCPDGSQLAPDEWRRVDATEPGANYTGEARVTDRSAPHGEAKFRPEKARTVYPESDGHSITQVSGTDTQVSGESRNEVVAWTALLHSCCRIFAVRADAPWTRCRATNIPKATGTSKGPSL